MLGAPGVGPVLAPDLTLLILIDSVFGGLVLTRLQAAGIGGGCLAARPVLRLMLRWLGILGLLRVSRGHGSNEEEQYACPDDASRSHCHTSTKLISGWTIDSLPFQRNRSKELSAVCAH
jgi:hypothetical protein